MTVSSGAGSSDAGNAPLAGLTAAVLGDTRGELLLTKLLTGQGARIVAGHDADLVIDAERDDGRGSLGADEAADLVARGSIYCLFVGRPGIPPSSETLLAAEVGLNRVADPLGDPQPEPLAILSGYAAIWAALYLTAALRMRLSSGKGTRIEVPLQSAALSVVGRSLISMDRAELIDPLRLPKLPISDIYRCRDGRYVQSHGTFPHFAEILCTTMGHPEWAAGAATGVSRLPSAEHVEMWRKRFAEEFMKRDALEWETTINAAGGACTMCRSHEEWRAEQVFSDARMVSGPPVAVSAEEPVRGRHSSTRGFWPGLGGRRGPLSDVQVVDLCIILAGPTCGRTLAEFGADVIKIDSPNRPVSPYGWLDVNRGKRSMIIDLKSSEGAQIVRDLAMGADVVLENFRAGKMASLGVGYEELREVRPDIVYGSMNAFDFETDWAPRAGWEHNAQAGSGMQVARQRDGEPRPVPVPVNDYATGLLAALGVMLGILRRDRTGAPARARASLARTATFLQLGEYDGDEVYKRRLPESAGVRTTDGWIRAESDAATVRATSTLSAAQAVRRLGEQGVRAVVECVPTDLLHGDELRDEGLVFWWDHPHWGHMSQGMAKLRANGIEVSPGWPAPDPGEHTRGLLAELGRDAAEIDRLAALGAIGDRRALFEGGEVRIADSSVV